MHPEFPLSEEIVHLNHAGVAPWPRRTAEAVARFAEENATRGPRHYARWLETEDGLRERLRRLINAPAKDDIAIVKNTSEALSVIAYGLDWQPGDNVVTARQEFPSNRIVWESLAARFGVEVRMVDLDGAEIPEKTLLEAVDVHTRLLAVSSVQYISGARLDLERVGEACRANDTLFCVDAIQSLGAVPFDAQACRADFVAADGHKWMLGPEGVALLYCHPERREALRLNQFGWHMMADNQDFERLDWQPAPSARRFECGSPNSLGIHALDASLSLIEETGIERIHEAISEKISYLHDFMHIHEFEILTPPARARRAGILTFRRPEYDMRALHQGLREAGVLCALRGGGIRWSPHFYTPQTALDRALELLRQALR